MGIFFKDRQRHDDSLPEDTLLAFKASEGDDKAFEALVRKYERLVSTCVFSVIGNNPEDVMDVSQEVFLKVYRSLSSFKGDSEFSTWLYRVAKNCALDYIRKRKPPSSSLDTSGDEGEGFDVPDTSESSNPEKSVLQAEKSEILKRSIEKLSEEHREIIILRHVNDYSYEQIAKQLDLEVGTVKSRISRAREALKKILLKENYF